MTRPHWYLVDLALFTLLAAQLAYREDARVFRVVG